MDAEAVGVRGEGIRERPGTGAEIVLGDDVGRRPELGGELQRVAAAELEAAAPVQVGAEGVGGGQLSHGDHREA